jgi:hypothetical protein
MSANEFLSKCNACGGDWTSMLMSGIHNVFPEYHKQMEDREYDLFELFDITAELGVNWED